MNNSSDGQESSCGCFPDVRVYANVTTVFVDKGSQKDDIDSRKRRSRALLEAEKAVDAEEALMLPRFSG